VGLLVPEGLLEVALLLGHLVDPALGRVDLFNKELLPLPTKKHSRIPFMAR
jgi:hypothetical protein